MQRQRPWEHRGGDWSDAATSQGTPGATDVGTESPLEPPEGVWPPCQDSAALGPSEAPRARRQQAILVARQKSDNRHSGLKSWSSF